MNHEIAQDYLNSLYQEMNGYLRYSPDEVKKYLVQDVCLTYGEVLYPSLIRFAQTVCLKKEDVFLDLGSGLGKVCASIALGTPCGEVMGIEASENLHQQVAKILPKLQALLQAENKKITLIQGNFLSPQNFAEIKRATVVFINSTAFTYDLLDKIAEVLNQCSNIRAVLSFKPFANLTLPFYKTVVIEASWDSILSRLYAKKPFFHQPSQ